MTTDNAGTKETAAADPLIAWLEEIRDFEGSTDRAREMSTLAIARLTSTPAAAAPRKTADEKIQGIVDGAREETERGRAARRQP